MSLLLKIVNILLKIVKLNQIIFFVLRPCKMISRTISQKHRTKTVACLVGVTAKYRLRTLANVHNRTILTLTGQWRSCASCKLLQSHRIWNSQKLTESSSENFSSAILRRINPVHLPPFTQSLLQDQDRITKGAPSTYVTVTDPWTSQT